MSEKIGHRHHFVASYSIWRFSNRDVLLSFFAKFENLNMILRWEVNLVSNPVGGNRFQIEIRRTNDVTECNMYWKNFCSVIQNQLYAASAKHIYLKPFLVQQYSHPMIAEIGNQAIRAAEISIEEIEIEMCRGKWMEKTKSSFQLGVFNCSVISLMFSWEQEHYGFTISLYFLSASQKKYQNSSIFYHQLSLKICQ